MQVHTAFVQACTVARRSCLVFMQARWMTVQAYIDPIHACILPKPPRIVAVVACMFDAAYSSTSRRYAQLHKHPACHSNQCNPAYRVIKGTGNMLMKLL